MTFQSPPDDFQAPFWLPMETFIVNGSGFDINPNSPIATDVILEINRPAWTEGPDPQAIFVYGRAYYWDVFADRTAPNAQPYLTQWMFRYDPYRRRFTRCAGGYARNT
jgi:hypothetical protein